MRKCVIISILLIASLVLLGPGTPTLADAESDAKTDRAVLKAVVHSAATGLSAIAVKKNGKYNAEMLRKYVNAVRFFDDESGYFFIYNYTNNYNVAIATMKDWPGTDKTNHQDSHGTFIIQELSKLAKSPAAGGFFEYYFNNPVSKRDEKKISYIEVIPGTTLYIGAGFYLKE